MGYVMEARNELVRDVREGRGGKLRVDREVGFSKWMTSLGTSLRIACECLAAFGDYVMGLRQPPFVRQQERR